MQYRLLHGHRLERAAVVKRLMDDTGNGRSQPSDGKAFIGYMSWHCSVQTWDCSWAKRIH